ncbi:MAG TPA: DUF1206 domain-containing protein [Gemmatimonadales bacterium]
MVSTRNALDEVTREAGTAIDRIARLGFAAKGLVALMIGALALELALGRPGGSLAGPNDALRHFLDQRLGWFTLGVLAVGLWAYALWKLVQAFFDPEQKGTSFTGMAERIGFGITALGYLVLGLAAVQLLLGHQVGGATNPDQLAAHVLSAPLGRWVTGLVGGIVVISGIVQVRFGLSGGFRHILRLDQMSAAGRVALTLVAGAGYVALGIISAVVGWFLIQVALHYDPRLAGGWSEALGFLAGLSEGRWVLGVVGAGLFCYGLYFIFLARYRRRIT